LEEIRTKRVRRDPETTRKLILDAAERIMVEEGYAAVSSRRIAQEIGLNPATIHYYYPATDDLFIALHRRMTDQQVGELEAVLAAHDPLAALWKFQSDWGQTALGVEFLSLANHRKALQPVLARAANDARTAQAAALGRALSGSGDIPPVALTTILVAVARTLANEERVGITEGHREVRAVVEEMLRHLSAGTAPG
jgi:TetR/AcrR family transcriptional regulator, regulator of autoinduction and epiphytic fitness